jgi:CENP-B N-terminal DNA-binding domain
MAAKKKMKKAVYRQKKHRDLTDFEKQQIKQRLESGESDTAKLAEEFGCVPTQIAAIKAWRKM